MVNSDAAKVVIGLSVAGVAAELGLTPATIRTWDRRYGLSPSSRTAGKHRRYTSEDMTRLRATALLVDQGLPPADAAAQALSWSIRECQNSLAKTSSEHLTTRERDRGRTGGGNTLALPDADAPLRGLARAAMALDGDRVVELMRAAINEFGVVQAWDDFAVPTLKAVGDRWERTAHGVEVEHVTSRAIGQAFEIDPDDNATGRPVVLSCAPEEQHSLALVALRAALTTRGIPVTMLGARVPPDALNDVMRRLRPRAVVVWATMPQDSDTRNALIVPKQRPPIRIYLAGPGWDVSSPQHGQYQRLNSLADAVAALS